MAPDNLEMKPDIFRKQDALGMPDPDLTMPPNTTINPSNKCARIVIICLSYPHECIFG